MSENRCNFASSKREHPVRHRQNIALWCNGSTQVSGTFSEGSSPSKATQGAEFIELGSFLIRLFLWKIYHRRQPPHISAELSGMASCPSIYMIWIRMWLTILTTKYHWPFRTKRNWSGRGFTISSRIFYRISIGMSTGSRWRSGSYCIIIGAKGS